MNSRAFSSVGILALLGLLFHLAPIQNEGGRASNGGKESAAQDKANSTKAQEKPKPHEGPWVITCRHFGLEPKDDDDTAQTLSVKTALSKLANPVSDDGTATARRELRMPFCLGSTGIRQDFIVATIANPSETRLGYFADRAIESIRRAVQTAGWDYDSQWLPWKQGINADGEKAWLNRDQLNGEPGLLLFRDGNDALMFVFLVGETPTGGVDQASLRKAFDYGMAISSPLNSTVTIAGPTFSGSAPSLRRGIDEFAGKTPYHFEIASGTMTSEGAAKQFQQPLPSDRQTISFHGTSHNSASTLKNLKATACLLQIGTDRVTILNEEETVFGKLPNSPGEGIHVIQFPREISALRNAYQESGASGSPGLATRLPFTLHDSDGGEDSVPTFARKYTPQSQYAIIGAIVDDLRKTTDLVEINATSVLDALFLSEVIREGSPGTRILLPEADILFVRAAREQGLTGIFSLSTYPVSLAGKDAWAPRRALLPFADSHAEGIFNAVTLLLRQKPNARVWKSDQPPALDYVDFYQNTTLPPQWLLESTLSGFRPIQRFANDNGDTSWFLPDVPDHFSAQSFYIPHTNRQWWVLFLLTITVLLWLLRLYAKSKSSRPRGADLFAPLSEKDDSRWHRRLHAGIFISLGTILAILLLPLIAARATELPRLRLLAFSAMDLATGASPLLCLILLLSAFALGCLVHLHRVSLAANRDPWFPTKKLKPTIAAAMNVRRETLMSLARGMADGNASQSALIAGAALLTVRPWSYLRTPEGGIYLLVVFVLAFCLFLWIVWSAKLFFNIWRQLSGFLIELARLPMEGAFDRIPRTLSAAQIWNSAPGWRSYSPFFRALDCLQDLKNIDAIRHEGRSSEFKPLVVKMEAQRSALLTAELKESIENYEEIATCAWECADHRLESILVPRWREGKIDPLSATKEYPPPVEADERIYRLAAEFVALRYSAYIRYVMMQLRNLAWFVSGGFVLLALALTSLDAQDPAVIRWFLTFLMAPLGYLIVVPLIEMERNELLSLMADSKPGELNADFFVKFASYGLAPLLGIMASHFPSLSRFLFSWLQPTLETLK